MDLSRIRLSLPLKAEFVSVVRLTGSGIASRAGFDFDAVEDIKVCLSEVCNSLLNDKEKRYSNVDIDIIIEFVLSSDSLTINFKAENAKGWTPSITADIDDEIDEAGNYADADAGADAGIGAATDAGAGVEAGADVEADAGADAGADAEAGSGTAAWTATGTGSATDAGIGADAEISSELEDEGNYGLMIARVLMDEFDTNQEDGIIVSMTKRITEID